MLIRCRISETCFIDERCPEKDDLRLRQTASPRQSVRRGYVDVGPVHEEEQIRLQQIRSVHLPQVEQGTHQHDGRGPNSLRARRFCHQIFGWKPEYYNDTKNLPSTMPADLQEHIKAEEHANRLDTVWVSCSGENPADVENMGAIQYIPRRGFPGYYFPFTNTPGYLSPLVAVFFERPKCKFYICVYARR